MPLKHDIIFENPWHHQTNHTIEKTCASTSTNFLIEYAAVESKVALLHDLSLINKLYQNV